MHASSVAAPRHHGGASIVTMPTAAPLIPEEPDLDTLERAAAGCTACDLHLTGTQTVFGDGAQDARVMFVGEQPGDREDVEGAPFVGPAGRELDRGLEEVGIDRDDVYVTNVVKHFKWKVRRGKRRIHETPTQIEIRACLPWMRAELDVVEPDVVVALGATAAKALISPDFRVTRQHGQLHRGIDGAITTATLHPSSILRRSDDEDRREVRAAFHADLDRVRVLVERGIPAALRLATVDELYARARDLDVAGRSTMDKASLVGAVAEHLRGAGGHA